MKPSITPPSDTIDEGIFWSFTASVKNISDDRGAYFIVWHGMKCHIFESQSTTTLISSNLLHFSSPTTQSIYILSQGLMGTDNGVYISNIV